MFTALALVAFAANSVLCRAALKGDEIDAAGFTAVRLLSGMCMFSVLWLITRVNTNKERSGALPSRPESTFKRMSALMSALKLWQTWSAPFMLFLYAVSFSFAYISLDTGVGALVLFGCVQLTVIGVAITSGSRLHWLEWVGVFISFLGLTYLLLPAEIMQGFSGMTSALSLSGFALMVVSGIAWGFYTHIGRISPVAGGATEQTAVNFFLTLPFVFILCVVHWYFNTTSSGFGFLASMTVTGFILAVLSGALASALGYALWYKVLPTLSAPEAGVLQLSVPVIATVGGMLFVAEPITVKLLIAIVLVLGGIAMVLFARQYSRHVNRV